MTTSNGGSIDPDLMEILKNHPKFKGNTAKIAAAVVQIQTGETLPEHIPSPTLSETISNYQKEMGAAPPPEPVGKISQIPEFMQSQKRWTVFRKVWNTERNKFNKMVCTPTGGQPYAGYPNPENQYDFGYYADIKKLCEYEPSFVPAYYILKKDGLIFLDYDEPGYVPNYPTYTERSISGGCHVLGWFNGSKPTLPDTKEVYLERRWIVMTGDVVEGKVDINDVTDLFTPSATPAPGQYAPSFKVPEKIASGERNNVLFKLACSLRKKGLSVAAMSAAIHAENQVRCDPPLPDDEISGICSSAVKYPQGGGQSHPHNAPPPTGGETCQPPACSLTPIEIGAAESAGELRDRGNLAIAAIATVYNNPEKVFVRKNELVRVILDEKRVPKVKNVSRDGATEILASCINWYKKMIEKDPDTGAYLLRHRTTKLIVPLPLEPGMKPFVTTSLVKVPATPPEEIIKYVLGKEEWTGLPPLQAIIECPYIEEGGNIVSEYGYNWDNGLYLSLEPGFGELNVPEDPTKEDVIAAKKLLDDLYADFVFEDEASRQNNISCLITAIIRPFIPGVTPLFAYDKPVMGAGASLLGEIISAIITCRSSTNMAVPKSDNEEEWRKFILSCVKSGRTFFVLDNIDGAFYNSALASVLTSLDFGGRQLGGNELVGYPNVGTWVCNGNNLVITGDLSRRIVYIRLIADVERPYERTGFKIPEIAQYVTEHRAEYIRAVLTITRAWIREGQPAPSADLQVMGGYESWRRIVGGIMNFVKYNEFLKNTKRNLDLSEVYLDEDAEVLSQICEIQSKYARERQKNQMYKGQTIPQEFTTKDIAEYMKGELQTRQPGEYELIDYMPDHIQEMVLKRPKGVSRAVGKMFGRVKGRVFPNGCRIDQVKISHQVIVYRITSKEERVAAAANIGGSQNVM